MKRRRLAVWGGFGVIALAGVIAMVVLFKSRVRVNQETFDRVQMGMTEKEVERLIGAPAGWYCDGVPFFDKGVLEVEGNYKRQWLGNDAVICVGFTDGKVVDKQWRTVLIQITNPQPTFWDKAKRWLGI